MRVVVDCNVIISAGLNSDVCQKVILEIADHHAFVLSTDILREDANVSSRDKFRKDQQKITDLTCQLHKVSALNHFGSIKYGIFDTKRRVA